MNIAAWHHPRLLPVLDAWQRGFPLVQRPYAHIAAQHGYGEAALLADLRAAQSHGVLGRVGGIFAPNTVGASTLAAVRVPPAQIEHAAQAINAHPEVNHNYQRAHDWNLWFVVAAPSAERLRAVLNAISAALNTPVLDLPLEAEYHVDLGFALQSHQPKAAHRPRPAPVQGVTPAQRRLMGALGQGLAIAPTPYADLAAHAGMTEEDAMAQLADWCHTGVLRRLGFVVRHHELGYTANAMCVWAVPMPERDRIGHALAQEGHVHLCYARPARGADWPYNLFCMVHGKDRADVLAHVAQLAAAHGLQHVPHAALFSTRRFKQTGARYH